MSTYELLEKRIAALEQEVEGEKVLSRYILEQARHNGDDIAAMRTQLTRLERRVDGLEAELRALRSEFRAFREDFPKLVADVMREVLAERDRR